MKLATKIANKPRDETANLLTRRMLFLSPQGERDRSPGPKGSPYPIQRQFGGGARRRLKRS
jgi:hypothetical protein